MEKKCNICSHNKDLNNFYKTGKYYQSACKPCYLDDRKVKYRKKVMDKPMKKFGFEGLSDDKKEELLTLVCFKMGLTQLSEATGIKYATLFHWTRMQWIPRYSEYYKFLAP